MVNVDDICALLEAAPEDFYTIEAPDGNYNRELIYNIFLLRVYNQKYDVIPYILDLIGSSDDPKSVITFSAKIISHAINTTNSIVFSLNAWKYFQMLGTSDFKVFHNFIIDHIVPDTTNTLYTITALIDDTTPQEFRDNYFR